MTSPIGSPTSGNSTSIYGSDSDSDSDFSESDIAALQDLFEDAAGRLAALLSPDGLKGYITEQFKAHLISEGFTEEELVEQSERIQSIVDKVWNLTQVEEDDEVNPFDLMGQLALEAIPLVMAHEVRVAGKNGSDEDWQRYEQYLRPLLEIDLEWRASEESIAQAIEEAKEEMRASEEVPEELIDQLVGTMLEPMLKQILENKEVFLEAELAAYRADGPSKGLEEAVNCWDAIPESVRSDYLSALRGYSGPKLELALEDETVLSILLGKVADADFTLSDDELAGIDEGFRDFSTQYLAMHGQFYQSVAEESKGAVIEWLIAHFAMQLEECQE